MNQDLNADAQSPAFEQYCALESRVFAAVGEIVFRRAESDGTPVMSLSLGDRDAVLPLRAVQREFGISDASPDGRMLGLIAESLDYVSALRLGDTLPSEVLSGDASWCLPARYREVAAGRMRLQLLAWAEPEFLSGQTMDPAALERLASDPHLRSRLQAAFECAAASLGLSDPATVTARVAAVAHELGYMEALRGTLLRRVQAVTLRFETLSHGLAVDADRLTVMTQVRRLAGRAVEQIAARFVDVDARTGEVMAALRHADSLRAFIRSNRDWLYKTGRAWEPILAEWETAGTALDEAAWLRIGRAYRFLAPRHMSVQEWLEQAAPRRFRDLERAMCW